MSSEESGWVDVTSGVGALTKGSYVELISSTLFASTWMSFQVYCDLTNTHSGFDLATGEAASEVIILDDQLYHFRNNSGGNGRGNTFSFPMTIPAGTRLSVRVQDGEAGAILHQHTLTISNFTPPASVASTSDSSGKKTVVSGGLNAYGSWVELIAATTLQRGWMVVSLFTPTSSAEGELDIGIGAAGLEVPLMNDLAFKKSASGGANQGVTFSTYIYFPVTIASGTRIAARVKDNNASTRNYTVGVFVT